VDGGAFYSGDQPLKPGELVEGLLQREHEALELGYTGLRTHGDCAWVGAKQWDSFLDYEERVQHATRGRRMICMCSHCAEIPDETQLDLIACHDLTVPGERAPRALRTLSSPLRPEGTEARRVKANFDFAMSASHMGTWRYTIADNICVYDDNAQALYGLDGPVFLHDENGVKEKFYPDDLEGMWERVQRALDPQGDGRYDVEYRVRQRDGSWRWLSAWGLVEFEQTANGRKPIAIVGASRDLTQLKHAEELQKLLLTEMNHRVKNTLATLHAIAMQTLHNAPDLESATEALSRRIRSMALANDLLIQGAESGVDLKAVASRALEAFADSRIDISGPSMEVSPKHVLSLSMAFHELATNATKYGALSAPEGRVKLAWKAANNVLLLNWAESGGPKVAPPTRHGFGSHLLEVVVRDIGGASVFDFRPDGVRCTITAALQ
jgi:two-component sensor histidine kinase